MKIWILNCKYKVLNLDEWNYGLYKKLELEVANKAQVLAPYDDAKVSPLN